MNCAVCGQVVVGHAMQMASGATACSSCVGRLGSYSLYDADVKSCPACGYMFMPGWAKWYYESKSDAPACPACESGISKA